MPVRGAQPRAALSQPQGPARINRASPLAQGLISAFTIASQGTADAVSGRLIGANNSPGGARVVGAYGVGSTYSGTSADLATLQSQPGSVFTLFAVVRDPASSAYRIILDFDAVSSHVFQLRATNANAWEFIRFDTGTLPYFATGGTATAGDHTIVAVSNGSAMTLYVDGVQVATGTISNTPQGYSSTSLIIGASLSGAANVGGITAYPYTGTVYSAGVATRAWGLSDAKEFARNPWQLFEVRRRVWVPAGGGAAAEIGLATETDTALALKAAQQRGIGQAQETDTALALTSAQARAIGQAIEQDTALPLTSAQTAAIGLALEADIALPVGGGAAAEIGQAVESDIAQPLTSAQQRAIGQAVETDTALAVDVLSGGVLGVAQETDTALALAAAQQRAIGQAQETDTALALQAAQAKAIGQAIESDIALPVQGLLGIGVALEIDIALPMVGVPPPPPPPASESTTTTGYRRNPRTARDLDPLPPVDLADQVREKWDAIERANEALRRARRGPPPAAVAAVPAPAPKPTKPRDRRASAAELAAVAGGLGVDDLVLTPEQRADEEAFILLVAELV